MPLFSSFFFISLFNGFLLIFIASAVPNKDCSEILRNKSGWISSPDNDGDGFYDFNLNCFWIVEVDPGKLIRFQFMYVDLEFYYVPEDLCQTDIILVSIMSMMLRKSFTDGN